MPMEKSREDKPMKNKLQFPLAKEDFKEASQRKSGIAVRTGEQGSREGEEGDKETQDCRAELAAGEENVRECSWPCK